MPDDIVLFFDIGDTLAAPRVTSAGKLEGLDVYPLVKDVLAKLHETDGPGGAAVRLGLLSNTGLAKKEEMKGLLETAGLLGFFEEALLVFSGEEGVDKSSREIFDRAREKAGVPAGRCVFVGESEPERKVARTAGFEVSFHPLHAFHVIGRMMP